MKKILTPLLLTIFALCACSTGAVSNTTSLSPIVRDDTVGYNTALSDISDQILLTSILRARDHAPLNMSELSSISGALSLSGTLGLTAPFGTPVTSSNTRHSLTPSIAASTSPTFSLTPLNTEGFTLNSLQPIAASYVANRWDAGISPRLLLMLFVKEIDFSPKTAPREGSAYRYFNNPDDEKQLAAFFDVIDALLASGAQLRTFDVLDPVGGWFALPGSATFSGLNVAMSASDGQYHVGNGKNDGSQGQLYRVYTGQVVLCVDAQKMVADHPEFSVPHVDAVKVSDAQKKRAAELQGKGSTSQGDQKNLEIANLAIRLANEDLVATSSYFSKPPAGQATTAPTTAIPTANPKAASAGAGPGSAASTQATTAALQAGRISAIVSAAGCRSTEIVLSRSTEEEFQHASEGFARLQWRSVVEVIDYLGAILRYKARRGSFMLKDVADALVQSKTIDSEKSALTASPNFSQICAPSDYAAGLPAQCIQARSGPWHLVFDVSSDEPARGEYLATDYRGTRYSIKDASHGGDDSLIASATTDDSMVVFSMLSTLVNLAKTTSDITSSQPLRLLPLP